jgi:phosphoribosylanthranilate isomerase
VIVQIYSLTDPDDVRMLVALGVDHIGVAPAGQGLLSELPLEETRALFALMPPHVNGSALTVRTNAEQIAAMAEAVQPAIVHICAPTAEVEVTELRRLRSLLPDGVRVMTAVEVGGPETAERAVATAEQLAPVSDYLLLDTDDPEITGIGAVGRVHDWDVSARIVEQVGADVPVILAGGLNPDNVAAAIRHVRPAGVDSFTWTNSPANSRRKDPERVRRFVREARAAAAELGL